MAECQQLKTVIIDSDYPFSRIGEVGVPPMHPRWGT